MTVEASTMARWKLEPGHTAAEFKARHMMVTWVRGHFANIHGTLQFDPAAPTESAVDIEIDVSTLWSGDPQRDEHLLGADFLDAANHPKMLFKGTQVEQVGQSDYRVTGDLTLRGVTREAILDVRYLGQWPTPFWEDGVDKGPKQRAGFVATTTINRHDFGVSWQSPLDKGGVVVGNEVSITIDAEALVESERTVGK